MGDQCVRSSSAAHTAAHLSPPPAAKYPSPLEFLADMQLVWDNCREVGAERIECTSR